MLRRICNIAVFYLGWIGMILAETYAWAIFGFALGMVIFVTGGVAWAYWHSKNTPVGELDNKLSALYAPTLWAGYHATRLHQHAGLAFNTLLNGSPGVGLVETSMGYSWHEIRSRVWIASSAYAALWCLLHYLRPPLFIPIYWYPSADAFYATLGLFV